jgi:hypothetical protein
MEAGLPPMGKRRFGYLPADAKTGRMGNMEEHPEEGPQVRALFAAYLGGKSINALATQMGWRRLRVRETLTNPAYAGTLKLGDITYEANEAVARLISKEEFQKVQVRLSDQSSIYRGFNHKGGQVKHLASGIARCGVCDTPMQFRNNYMCLNNPSHPTIKEEFLDEVIDVEIIKALMKPNKNPGEEMKNFTDLQATIKDLEEQKADILSGLADKRVKMADLKPYLDPVLKALTEAQEASEAMLRESVQARMTGDIAASVTHSGAGAIATVLVRYQSLGILEKRALIHSMLDIKVMPGRVTKERVIITPKKNS